MGVIWSIKMIVNFQVKMRLTMVCCEAIKLEMLDSLIVIIIIINRFFLQGILTVIRII